MPSSTMGLVQLLTVFVLLCLAAITDCRSFSSSSYTGDVSRFNPEGLWGEFEESKSIHPQERTDDLSGLAAPPISISDYWSSPSKRFGALYQRPQRRRYHVKCLINPVTCYGDEDRKKNHQ